MITEKQIRSKETLKDLSDFQIAMIVDMAGEAQKSYDEAFTAVLGVERPPKENPVEFWKGQVLAVRKKAAKFNENPVAPIAGDLVDVRAAGSRVEAMQMIKDSLRAAGISPMDPRYQKIKDKTWNEIVLPRKLKFI